MQLAGRETFQQRRGFFGPETGKPFEDWTPAVRQREQDVLSPIEALDAWATKLIDEALQSMP